MIQGTGSDVGKSLLVAGLGRAFTRRGLRVRPFKPQNMSNNASVTMDGGEIGRAQALQAQACGAEESVHMNPILLKPQSDTGSQLVVQGRAESAVSAYDYHKLKPRLLPRIMESFHILERDADLILVEGAGSPAEVNLRGADIANMGFACAAGVPVVLVGDIGRGGVIAALVGTHALLSGEERELLKGYVINKFRGDECLFTSAIDIIEDKTGLVCFGILPQTEAARRLPDEDSMALDGNKHAAAMLHPEICIVVPRLSRIANFDDLDPLAAEPGVAVDMIPPGEPLPLDVDLILIPGSKSTLADLTFLREQGWDADIHAHLRRGGRVLGLCAGYQMLGHAISDPHGLEGQAGTVPGLGLLNVKTVMTNEKTLLRATGTDGAEARMFQGGYEIHLGETSGPDCARPMSLPQGQQGGATTTNGLVQGCYLHGLFADDAYRCDYLKGLKAGFGTHMSYAQGVEDALDELAALCEARLDLDRLLEIAHGR
jgi:adenosylcobyric acid synthase